MIYCVEDDAAIRDIEVYALRSTGFEAEGLESGEELFAAVKRRVPELIILDVMLPGRGRAGDTQAHTLLRADALACPSSWPRRAARSTTR